MSTNVYRILKRKSKHLKIITYDRNSIEITTEIQVNHRIIFLNN